MTVRRKYIFSVVVIVVLALSVSLSIIFLRSRDRDVDHIDLAFGKLSKHEAVSVDLDVDFFIDPSNFSNSDSAISNEITASLSGNAEFSVPSSGLVKSEANLAFMIGEPSFRMLSFTSRLSDEGMIYAKISDLPAMALLSAELSELNGVWFSAGTGILNSLLPWTDNTDRSARRLIANPAPIDSAKLRSRLVDLFHSGVRFEDTMIDSRKVTHREIVLDTIRIEALLAHLTEASRGEPITEIERQKISDWITARDFMAEAWVDLQTGELTMLKVGVFPKEETNVGTPLAFSVKFNDYDEAVQVNDDEPNNARPLPEVLTSLFSRNR